MPESPPPAPPARGGGGESRPGKEPQGGGAPAGGGGGSKEPQGGGAPAPAPAAGGGGGGAGGGRRPSAFELDIGGIIAKSTVMAIVFAAPPIGIFLALHHYTGSVLVGAVVGFGAHFAILAFSPRIAQLLIRSGPGAGGDQRQ